MKNNKKITDEYILEISPEWFKKSFAWYKECLEYYNDWKLDSHHMGVVFCEFQSDINVAESSKALPQECIDYLRDKYIYE